MTLRRAFVLSSHFSRIVRRFFRHRRSALALVVAALLVGLLFATLAFAVTHPPAVTGLTSPTHPDENAWYEASSANFSWTAPPATDAAVAGYSYWIDHSASSSDPSPAIDLQAFTLVAAVGYTTGAEPYSIAVGDLNADGKPDLVTANSRTGVNTVSVLLGNGNGTFAAKQDFTTGAAPMDVAVADIDGDGKPDVVTGNYLANTVSVLRNTTTTGSATLSFAVKADFNAGLGSGGAAVADLNADGKPDIVTANNDTTTVSALRNTSSGSTISFAAKQDFTVGSSPYSVAVADFDADGKDDLVTANNGSSTASVLRNTTTAGATTFAFAAKSDVITASGPYAVVAADVNGDATPDLAVACATANKISVLVNTGSSSISFGAKVDYGVGTAPWDVAAADVNGDGTVDLAVANSGTANMSVLPGNGNGTFATTKDYAAGTGTVPSAVDACDFNADGKTDLAVGSLTAAGKAFVFLNARSTTVSLPSSDGTWYFHVRAIDSAGAGGTPAVRKVCIEANGPTMPSLTSPTHPQDWTWYADHDPTLTWSPSTDTGSGVAGYSYTMQRTSATPDSAVDPVDLTDPAHPRVSFSDLEDGRWYFRLAAVDNVGHMSSVTGLTIRVDTTGAAIIGLTSSTHPDEAKWYAETAPEFSWNQSVDDESGLNGYSYELDTNAGTVPDDTVDKAAVVFDAWPAITSGLQPRAPATGDFDGDGDDDVAVPITPSAGSGAVSVALAESGGFALSPEKPATGSTPTAVAVADFDADTKLDLAVSTAVGVSVLAGHGDGTFGVATGYSTGGAASSVAVGDVNADGKKDLVVAGPGPNVGVLLGNGNGTFQAVTSYAVLQAATGVAVSDLDDDGDDDIAAIQAEGALSIVVSNGNGTFQAHVDYYGGCIAGSLAVGDWSGDGVDDLVLGGQGPGWAGMVSLVRGNGNATFTAWDTFTAGATDCAVAVADVDRDGRVDIATACSTIDLRMGGSEGIATGPITFGAQGNGIVVGDFDADGTPDLASTATTGGTLTGYVNGSDEASFSGCTEGVWYLHIRAIDKAGNAGPTATRAVRVETAGPASAAPDHQVWQTDGAVRAAATGPDGTTYIGGDFTYVGPTTGSGVAFFGDGTTFPEVNGAIKATVGDGAGGFYIGGDFTQVGEVTRNRIAHLLSDGTVDPAFDPNANNSVNTLAVSGGTIYAGGAFTTIAGQTRTRIAALSTATGAATSWNPSVNGPVYALAVSGTTVYVGGSFGAVNGSTMRGCAAAFYTTNGVASGWDPNTDGQVLALAVSVSGTRVYLGGDFHTIRGEPAPCFGEVDADFGNSSGSALGADARVSDIAVLGTTVYAAGEFHTIWGYDRRHVAALLATSGGDILGASLWIPDPDAAVSAIAVSASGATVYVGGAFTLIGSSDGRESRNRLAILDASTGAVSSWNPGANGVVDSLAVSGSRLYAGGQFTSVGGYARRGIAALDDTTGAVTSWRPNLTGTVNALQVTGSTIYAGGSFTGVSLNRSRAAVVSTASGDPVGPFPDVNGTVSAAVADGSGGYYLGGAFSTIGGVARTNIAHVLTDGSVDPSFAPAANGIVNTLAVSGSTLYAGGAFTTIGGQTRSRIAALDCATGAASPWNPTANGSVNALAVSGTTVYAGGAFTSIGGASRGRLAALNASTGAATTWNPFVDSGNVNALVVSGTNVYIGGTFTGINTGVNRYRIAVVDVTTGTATACNPDIRDGAVNALAVSGSTIYAGGSFTSVNFSATRNRIAAFDATTGTATAWNPNANGTINALAVSGSTLYAGGAFTTIGGMTRNRLATFDMTTGLVTSWDPNANGTINALAVTASKVCAGGEFTTIGLRTRNRIVALDGASGAATSWDPNANGVVNTLAVSGSTVYAGGEFTTIGGQTRNRVAALPTGSSAATVWDPNANGIVYAVAASGSTVYVGGSFTTIGGNPRNRIAAFNSASSTATTWDPNANGTVRALAVSGSTVYAGGDFTTIGGQTRNRIAAFDAGISAATTWNPNASNVVSALAVSGSTLYAGGAFTTIGGQTRNCIAALHTDTNAATSWNPLANSGVGALACWGSTVYVGGWYTAVGSEKRPYVARFSIAPTGSIRINGGAQYAPSTSVTVNGPVHPATSMRFRNAGDNWSAWEPYRAARTWTLSSGDGAKMVDAQYRTQIGNVPLTLSDGIVLDTQAPAAIAGLTSSTHPVEATWYADADAGFSWNAATDAGSGVAGYSYEFDHTADTVPDAVVETTGTTVDLPGVGDGVWYFHVRAIDRSGRRGATATRIVRIDLQAPAAITGLASPTHPVESTWYTDCAPGFSWNAASDALSGLAGYSYVLDQSIGTTPDTALETAGVTASFADVTDGVWYFHVRAVDVLGNGGRTITRIVRVDTDAPGAVAGLVSSTHPAEGTWYSDSDPALSWEAAADGGAGVAGYSYVLDHSAGTRPDKAVDTTATAVAFSGKADGAWYFHVRAVGGNGSGGVTATRAVRIDTVAPGLVGGFTSSTHPVEASWYANVDPSVSWDAASDADSGVAGYSFDFDQDTDTEPDGTVDTTSRAAAFTGKAEGVWYLHVRAIDNVGHAGPAGTRAIRIDTAAPGAIGGLTSPTHPVEATWYSNSDPGLSWSAAGDSGSGVAGYSYEFDHAAGTVPDLTVESATTAIGLTGKADGVWYFHVRAVDNAGRGGTTATRQVRVDAGPPSAITGLTSPTHPVPGTWYDDVAPAFAWTAATDVASGVSGYSYVFDHEAATTPDTTIETRGPAASLSAEDDGLWYFHVRAVDALGHGGATATRAVRVDGRAPGVVPGILSRTHPRETVWYEDRSATVFWEPAADLSSGTSGYSYVFDRTADTVPDTTEDALDFRLRLAAGYAMGDGPRAVVITDLNGDGAADVATANQESNVSVRLGDGTGRLTAKSTFATGSGPLALAAGDYNGDGAQDLVTADSTANTVSLLLGDGHGGLATATGVASGPKPSAVVSGDFNGDGHLDVATADYDADTVSILLGDGSGGFAARTAFATGDGPCSLTVGDFNGDGKRDLAVADQLADTVSILLGDGSGGFAARTAFATGTHPCAVTVADLNADGKQDVATANSYAYTASVLLGDGSGGFAAKTDFATASGPVSITAGDFNHDGTQDIATVNTSYNTVSVLPGNGSGSLGARTDYGTGAGAQSIAVGDLNADGGQDLVTADFSADTISVLLANGSGGLVARSDVLTGHTPGDIASGDFNTDGCDDLVTANSSAATVSVVLGNGSGGFGAKTDYATGAGPVSVAIGDLNADGKQDLVTANRSGGNVSVLLGDGSGGFGAKTDAAAGAGPWSVAVADFNGDGHQDVVSCNFDADTVSLLPGNGNGGLGARTNFTTGDGPQSVAVGDFNNDGKQDLVTANSIAFTASILLGNGSGGFGAKTDVATGDWPYSVAVGDFNDDGKQDLTTANAGLNSVSVLLGNGSGGFGAKNDFSTGTTPYSVAVDDFDADGKQDLVTTNEGANTVSVLLGYGSGSFAPKVDVATGRWPVSVAVGDFDGDDARDLATANNGVDTASVLMNNGPTVELPSIADGLWYFHVRAVDEAGNGGPTATRELRIDTKVPTAVGAFASSTHPDEAAWYKDPDPVVSWAAASDAGCGVAGYSWELDDLPGTVPDATIDGAGPSASLSDLPDGVSYFHVRAVDALGHAGSTRTREVRIDTTPPLTTAGGVDDEWHNYGVLATLAAGDDRSGVARIWYCIDVNGDPDCLWRTWVYTSGLRIGTRRHNPVNGVYTFHYYSVDNAGNAETPKSVDIKIDTASPLQ